MAKVTVKKVRKRKVKKCSVAAESSRAVKPRLVCDDVEEEEAEENISSEEEEAEDDASDERKRQKLLEAISALGGKRKKKLGERSEAAVHISEFMVNADGEGGKVDLSDLIGTVDKTPVVPAKTKKQLKNLQQSKITIDCPLSKQESERIQRDVAFQKAATEVSRWKGVIRENQRAEHLYFPLNQEPSGPKAMERVVTGWKAQTPLEQEVFALLSANKQPVNDPVLTPVEEASLRAMSLEEAKIRRAELQKARALQSYYEAKTRRERKIKSKKYHKVHNKAKRKEFLKQFDEMVKTDPAAALEELNKIELARMQERMSLKHQNSSRWAKSKALMAKYDEGARKAMQSQLEVNKELTQKMVTELNNDQDDDEEEESSNQELMPDFVNDSERGPDPSNPWMRGKLSDDPREKEISDIVDVTEEGAGMVGNAAEEEEEVEETEDEAMLREFEHRRKLRQDHEPVTVPVISMEDDGGDDDDNKAAAQHASDEEEEELSEFTNLFPEIAKRCQEAEAERAEAAAEPHSVDSSPQLKEALIRIQTLEDMELLTQEESATDQVPVQPQPPLVQENLPSASQKPVKNRKRKRGIELKEVLTRDTKVIQVPLAPTVEDLEDSDEKLDDRGLIKEAFAGDNVISDFLNEKKRQEDGSKPKEVDLTLPGWGEWGGVGLKPCRSKRRRFRIKAAKPPPRKDQHLPNVIISEKTNSSTSLHQVNSLPFPFKNHMQFESTVRCPIGRTWMTEQTVKKITKPKVVTQMGAIIEPLSREVLMKDKGRVSIQNRCGVVPLTRKKVNKD